MARDSILMQFLALLIRDNLLKARNKEKEK